MRKEVELFFGSIVHDDRSVLEILDSNYTFLNERLAKHYGIEGVKGDNFRRVSLVNPDGTPVPHRGGVLEMAGVLTVTALPNRTSPVRRGKSILEQILGTPPPPPPADVPALPDKNDDAARQSLRQRMEQHRADPSCAACHMRMDPIGFAMENFDAVGSWRDRDGAFLIDPAGQLPGGTPLDGPDSLKKVLLDARASSSSASPKSSSPTPWAAAWNSTTPAPSRTSPPPPKKKATGSFRWSPPWSRATPSRNAGRTKNPTC